MSDVGTSVQVNFKVPSPCSVQNTSDSAHISADALVAGDTVTILVVVTPLIFTVCALVALSQFADIRVTVVLKCSILMSFDCICPSANIQSSVTIPFDSCQNIMYSLEQRVSAA